MLGRITKFSFVELFECMTVTDVAYSNFTLRNERMAKRLKFGFVYLEAMMILEFVIRIITNVLVQLNPFESLYYDRQDSRVIFA